MKLGQAIGWAMLAATVASLFAALIARNGWEFVKFTIGFIVVFAFIATAIKLISSGDE